MVQQLAVKIAKDSEKRNRQGFSMCSDTVLNASYVSRFFFTALKKYYTPGEFFKNLFLNYFILLSLVIVIQI